MGRRRCIASGSSPNAVQVAQQGDLGAVVDLFVEEHSLPRAPSGTRRR
jgi:hypothetical protein